MDTRSHFSPSAVKDWLHRTLGVNHMPTKYEVQTFCPECGGDVFYFNTLKQVGFCQKAKCNYSPTLHKLIELIGFGPEEAGYYEEHKIEEIKRPDSLPGYPIARVMLNELMTTDQNALDYLRSRQIPDIITVNWGLTSDGERIYIPIYDVQGMLVNYNSRRITGYPGPKYLYFPGAKTSHYILGWAESALWSDLVLVENTFVSLRYRTEHNVSTTFGSNVSDTQAALIARSNVKRVALLWDEGAEVKAQKAANKLRAYGVGAAYWRIKGQPDDYPDEFIAEAIPRVLNQATVPRKLEYDFTENK